MKKLFFCVIALAAVAFTANAQEKAVWGVRAGMNLTSMKISANGVDKSMNSKIGFNVGVSYQLPLVSKLFLETGLNLTSRGAKYKQTNSDVSLGTLKVNMLYVQLPVALSWHFNLKNVSLQPYVGAYYGFGISGKYKTDDMGNVNMFKKTTIEGEEMDAIAKRSDVGLRFGLGVAIHKHYYVGLGYDLGLSNIAKTSKYQDTGKLKNSSFYISLGYNF